MTAVGKTTLTKTLSLLGAVLLAGCTSSQTTSAIDKDAVTTATPIAAPKKVYRYTASDRECLKRAMYFESKRSSRDGLMAVGSVIMNRLTSGAYPDSICGVVSQEKQFAPGVMTRPVNDAAAPELNEAADAILRGERNPDVRDAMFFHQEGLKFPYDNMHYVTVAGGNAFYEKRDEDGELQTPAPQPADQYILSFAPHLSASPGMMAVNDMGATMIVAEADDAALPVDVPQPAPRPHVMNISTGTAPEIWSLAPPNQERSAVSLIRR